MTAIATGGGGFAQTQNGAAAYAGPNNIYLSRNHNLGADDNGFSLTFTLDSAWDATVLNILSGHTNNTGLSDQSYTSDLNFSLTGGTLGSAVTGKSTENYNIGPAYHSVDFSLVGTNLGAGTYTLSVFQDNNNNGSYSIYDGVTLEASAVVPEPSSVALISLGSLALILRRRR